MSKKGKSRGFIIIDTGDKYELQYMREVITGNLQVIAFVKNTSSVVSVLSQHSCERIYNNKYHPSIIEAELNKLSDFPDVQEQVRYMAGLP